MTEQQATAELTTTAMILFGGIGAAVYNRLSSFYWHKKHQKTIERVERNQTHMEQVVLRLADLDARERALEERERELHAMMAVLKDQFPDLKLTKEL